MGSCELSNELPVSIKDDEFLAQLNQKRIMILCTARLVYVRMNINTLPTRVHVLILERLELNVWMISFSPSNAVK